MNLTWKAKLAVVIGIIALISGLLLVIKYQRDIIAKQTAIQNSMVDMKKIQGDITRNQVQYATPADLDKFADSLNLKLGPIQDDLKTLKANVTAVQVITVKSTGEDKTNIASTTTEVRTDPIPANEPVDPYGYQKNKQTLVLTQPYGKTNVPLGSVDFSAWQKNPWGLSLYPEKYSVVDVIGTDENGKNYAYSKFSITSNGKTYDVDIDDAKMVEELPQSKFSLNLQLYGGFDMGTRISSPQFEIMPDLELMLFSYGKTKQFPDFSFLGLGFGYEFHYNNFQFVFSPANYNIAKIIPGRIVKNIYVGPSISVDPHGSFSVLGGVRVGL